MQSAAEPRESLEHSYECNVRAAAAAAASLSGTTAAVPVSAIAKAEGSLR